MPLLRVAAVAAGIVILLAACNPTRGNTSAGFWFEAVHLETAELPGGPLAVEDLSQIEAIARSELDKAFEGLRIAFSDSRDVYYRVRVVQRLQHPVLPHMVVSGESRAVAGFGGEGAVSFEILAGHAIAYAPSGATRATIIEGIGRGIGRAAAHEFAHQALPKAAVDSRANAGSYEHAVADRREQYYGPMQWHAIWPLLEERLGTTE